jgi:hypothetical protein
MPLEAHQASTAARSAPPSCIRATSSRSTGSRGVPAGTPPAALPHCDERAQPSHASLAVRTGIYRPYRIHLQAEAGRRTADRADVILGGDGDDNAGGLDGDDYIDGGTGNDEIGGDRGRDVLIGGPGDDSTPAPPTRTAATAPTPASTANTSSSASSPSSRPARGAHGRLNVDKGRRPDRVAREEKTPVSRKRPWAEGIRARCWPHTCYTGGGDRLTSTIRGAGTVPDHQERPPTALAHGAVKSGDIERVRRDVDQSEARVAHDQKTSAARKERELRRKAKRKQDAKP